MNIKDKLNILADSAKYDASCSSSGSNRINSDGIGNAHMSGICHSFASDGRCISLLKILMTNCCIFDCKYCINRRSNNVKRAIFTPKEIADLTISFYRRNYIEGLFLSSGIIKNPDYTMSLMIEAIEILRNKYKFGGYIHAKAIPGASEYMLKRLGSLVDRLSANIELPTESGLKLLAPNKETNKVNKIMKYVKDNKSRRYVPAGQSTQMIIGATKESDLDIMSKSEFLYQNFELKRVFYSAYVPVNKDNLLHILPSNDRIELIYGINFQQETDKSLAKIFLQELEEAKRHVRNCLDAKVYVETSNIPQDITKVDQAKNYSNGLVVFDLFAKDYEQIKKKFFYFVNFRQYIQFHIHSIKTFLHIRMNRKGKEIENKLSGCKIIPDEYIKELETLNFYVNWNKKEEQKKIFTSEVKKLNV